MPEKRRIIAIVPAAGVGSRMALGFPKQYMALAGRTMLEVTAGRLAVQPEIDEVLIVVSPEDEKARTLAFAAKVRLAAVGGATRAESVRGGLAASGAAAGDLILVHDAARPCVTGDEIRRLIEQAGPCEGGGLLALPVADTVKRAGPDGCVAATVPRQGLWRALTPQLFEAELLRRALSGDLTAVTDEACAVEALGLKPLLVEGSPRNIKVTSPADAVLAQAFLALENYQ